MDNVFNVNIGNMEEYIIPSIAGQINAIKTGDSCSILWI
jgi:hypothetical protein